MLFPAAIQLNVKNMLEQIRDNLIKGKAKEVKDLVEKAIKENINPADILNKGLLAGMGAIGERVAAPVCDQWQLRGICSSGPFGRADGNGPDA